VAAAGISSGCRNTPGLCSGTARTEECRSSKFGTRWYVNAAAAPLLQQFENYYGASH